MAKTFLQRNISYYDRLIKKAENSPYAQKREKKIPLVVLCLSIFNIGLFLFTSLGDIMLYSTLTVWQAAQGIVFVVLLFFGIKTFVGRRPKKWSMLLSGILMICFILLEFINEYLYFWKPGILWKNVFVICLLHHLIEGVRTVPKNILQDDELIPFRKELEHLEDYIVLEKVRFDDRIQFIKELEAEEFLIPPLVLQPIVENAIKHGLLRTKKGGSIYLKSRTEFNEIVIEIIDDGAGFDVEKPFRDGAVGINNVKFRLEYMIKTISPKYLANFERSKNRHEASKYRISYTFSLAI